MDWLKQLQKPNYWLLGIATALVALHLTLLDQADEHNLFSLSVLLWLGIGSLVWDKRDSLKLDSGIFSSFLGATLITFVLLRSVSPAGYHLRLSPFISGLGLCLIASGIKRLHYYWRELLILSLLVFYSSMTGLLQAINLPTLTAQFATLVLWIAGFKVYREGVFIQLPTGKVEVYGACSGVEIMILMFAIAILFLLMIPFDKFRPIICIPIAIGLGFVINAMRVALLAVLVAYSDPAAFDFWHGGEGSFIFSIIAVFLFGIYCWFFYVRKLLVTSDSGDN